MRVLHLHGIADLKHRGRFLRPVRAPRRLISCGCSLPSGLGGDKTFPVSISSRETRPRSIISVSSPASQISKAFAEIILGRTVFRAKRDMSMFQPPGRDIAMVECDVPTVVEYRLVRLGQDRAETLGAAHVMCAIHQAVSRAVSPARADHAVAGHEFGGARRSAFGAFGRIGSTR
jgi:hypothetical protein